jgi:hypothetical protein
LCCSVKIKPRLLADRGIQNFDGNFINVAG